LPVGLPQGPRQVLPPARGVGAEAAGGLPAGHPRLHGEARARGPGARGGGGADGVGGAEDGAGVDTPGGVIARGQRTNTTKSATGSLMAFFGAGPSAMRTVATLPPVRLAARSGMPNPRSTCPLPASTTSRLRRRSFWKRAALSAMYSSQTVITWYDF